MMVRMMLGNAWRERKRPHRVAVVLFLLAAIGFSVAAVIAHKWWEIPVAVFLAVGLVLLTLRGKAGSP
jgi:hypothetical protein